MIAVGARALGVGHLIEELASNTSAPIGYTLDAKAL